MHRDAFHSTAIRSTLMLYLPHYIEREGGRERGREGGREGGRGGMEIYSLHLQNILGTMLFIVT